MLILQEDQVGKIFRSSVASIIGRKKKYVWIIADWRHRIYLCEHAYGEF